MAEINNIDKAADDDLASGNVTREAILAALNSMTDYPDSAAIAELTAINAAVSGGGSIALTPATITALLGALTTANAPIVSGIGTTNSSLTSALTDLTNILLELDHMATDGDGIALTPATIAAIQQVTATILAFPTDYPNAAADGALTSILAAMSLNTTANNAITTDLAQIAAAQTNATQIAKIGDGTNLLGLVAGDSVSVPIAGSEITTVLNATSTTTLDCKTHKSVAFVVAGTYSVTPQISVDGVTWIAASFIDLSSVAAGWTSGALINQAKTYLAYVPVRYFRVSYNSGTVTGTAVQSSLPFQSFIGTVFATPNGTYTVSGSVQQGSGQGASPWTVSGKAPVTSLNAVSATGAGTALDCTGATPFPTLQVHTTGTVATISINLEGSNNGSNWVVLANSTSVATADYTLVPDATHTGVCMREYRANLVTITGSGEAVTALVSAGA